MSCSEIRQLLGVYVLGAIEPAERASVDTHLAGCAGCREELAGLAGLPALLTRVPAEQLGRESRSGPPGAGPALLDRLLARVAAHRRKVRWLTAAGATAVLVAAGGGAAGAYLAGGQSGASVSGPTITVSATNPRSDIWGRVTASERAWGTSLSVRLSGVDKYTTCRLVAVGAGGARSVAGSWRVTYRGDVTVAGATALSPAEIVAYEVVTDEGRRLLTIPAGDAG